MPPMEQFMYGSEGGRRGDRGWLLAASAGLGQDIAAEIRRLCENWGELPEAGPETPALLSVPLKATLSAVRVPLWAVMSMAPGESGFVHGVVMIDGDFAAFGHNPYALARVMPFATGWRRGMVLQRTTLQPESDERLVSPCPSAADRVFVTESVRHVLTTGSLLLPLE